MSQEHKTFTVRSTPMNEPIKQKAEGGDSVEKEIYWFK